MALTGCPIQNFDLSKSLSSRNQSISSSLLAGDGSALALCSCCAGDTVICIAQGRTENWNSLSSLPPEDAPLAEGSLRLTPPAVTSVYRSVWLSFYQSGSTTSICCPSSASPGSVVITAWFHSEPCDPPNHGSLMLLAIPP